VDEKFSQTYDVVKEADKDMTIGWAAHYKWFWHGGGGQKADSHQRMIHRSQVKWWLIMGRLLPMYKISSKMTTAKKCMSTRSCTESFFPIHKKKLSALTQSGNWLLHHNNMSAHQCLARNSITVLL
jgi:hypothetical protein